MLTHVTVTGIDHETPVHLLIGMAEQYPLAEVGILYSANPRGRNRYPSHEQVRQFALRMHGRVRLALHVCGREALDQVGSGFLRGLAWPFERIQLNGSPSPAQVEQACAQWPDKVVITQDRGNGTLHATVLATNHAILMDSSGGRGIRPAGWKRQTTEKACGFAGGLGPDTIKGELWKLRNVARGDWWIDAESGLRDSRDLFSHDRACRLLEYVHAAVATWKPRASEE